MEQICFAGGCFWGAEHYLRQFEGVCETMVGYANGNIPNPTYQQVYTDETGYVECVNVTYNPDIVSLATLCRLFFKSIDPLIKNRQGNDIGTRYRTGIYWSKEEDLPVIKEVYTEIQTGFGKPLAVELLPLECFYGAENYHRDYLINNPDGYCHLSFETLKFAKTYAQITRALRAFSSEEKKAILPKFFKTKEGEYGFGDKFMGVTVPCTRKVAKQFSNVSLDVVEGLLESEWHECRLCALLILVEKFSAHIKNEATISKTAEIVEFYLSHTQGVNNWDLVDLSAPYILGKYLLDKQDRSILYTLAQSENMWEQRISIVATLTLIRNNQLTDTLKLAESFLATRHNLIQKATGWMLREVGKKDEKALIDFLNKHKSQMPRTMLRYAIERFNPLQRKEFMG